MLRFSENTIDIFGRKWYNEVNENERKQTKMTFIKHRKECVEFYTLNGFKKLLNKNFGIGEIVYDEDNCGVRIGKHFWNWDELAGELGWFDGAEIVTDKNENERVMVWLNVG